MKRHRTGRTSGFTLIELLITLVIVSIAGLAIISSLIFGVYMRQSIRERNGAMRAAGDLMETTKKRLFGDLRTRTVENLVIDDRGTPARGDDIMGTMSLRFYDVNGTEVGADGGPLPLNLSMVRAEVTVQWTPPGRRSEKLQTVVLQTLLAP